MPGRARDNRTPDGGKRRWTPDERAARTRSSAAGRDAGSPRAARRTERFGADDTNGAPRGKRGIDWYPGPRTGKRADGPEGGDRAGRSGRDDRPRSGDRFSREDRPRSNDRFPRDERPRTGGRFSRDERPQRDDRPRSGDRFSRDDRPRSGDRVQRDDRPQRGDRFSRDDRPRTGDRFSRDERPRSGDRFERDDRPRHGDRPQREDRPQQRDRSSRDERPRSGDRFQRDDRPRRDDRPQRDDRFSRGDRAQRDDRFSRGDRPQRDDRFSRDERPRRDDRPQRDDRASRDDRPRRDDRFPRNDRPQREDRPRRDDRPHREDRFSRDDRPRRDDRAAHRPTAHHEAQEDVVLERLDAEVVTPDDVAGTSFADLGLGQQITRALAELGAVEPFPIQAATIPAALAGRNVLGRGRTGSGKTIAFGAALVERLMRNWSASGRTGTGRRMGRPPRALVLAPTRELALQIDRTVQPIARAVGLFTTQIVGGVPQGRQVGALAKGVDIVIGTPGRIEDLLEQGRLDLSDIEISVLDEADHMADLGFLEPMQRLLRRVPADGQRLLFSATLDAAVSELVEEFLPDPAVHEVADPEGSVTADHRVLVIEQGQKLPVLTALVSAADRSLVFARTRAFAEQLADDLDGEGVKAESLHGDLNQARRMRNLAKFTEGRVRALVATDVAARGIHVDGIDLVVHADSAEDYKTYLHRSGRTGRAGASGTVVTIITARRRRRFTELLERAGIEAEFVVLQAGDDPVEAIGR